MLGPTWGLSQTSEHGVRDVSAASSSPPGCELANRAVQHDENGEWQLAIECYVRAADEIEAFLNSGQPRPPNIDFAHIVAAYRTRASELTQDYSQEIAAQPGNNSAAASVSATASSMFQKFKSTAAKAASKTKETAIIVGNTANQPQTPPTPRRARGEHSQTRSQTAWRGVSAMGSGGRLVVTRHTRCRIPCFQRRFAGEGGADRAAQRRVRIGKTCIVERRRTLVFRIDDVLMYQIM